MEKSRKADLVAASEGGDDAVRAEAVQALLGGHGLFEHIQTDRTHELGVQTPGTDCDLGVVGDGILGCPV